jgi:UPF0755 protein
LNLRRQDKDSKRPLFQKLVLGTLALLILASLIVAFVFYRFIYAPNVQVPGKEAYELFIPTGSDYKSVKDSLQPILRNTSSFQWLADKKQYPELVKPGRYLIPDRINNLRLVNMLRAGEQAPVKITFNNVRLKEDLARIISEQLEADSSDIISLLNDKEFISRYGLNQYTVLTLFIPNTYEFYWNTSAQQFIERMKVEHDNFWDADRTALTVETGLSQQEITTLASIVEKETNKNDEKSKIAGVYMNRLKKGWPLQADPTVVYATGDFTATRVLNKHTRVDSPYNTYKNKGLPPGPICIPSIASIDAVLNYERHDYMYFVAGEDLSGYHVFSRTLREHNKHAKRYRKAVKEARKNN